MWPGSACPPARHLDRAQRSYCLVSHDTQNQATLFYPQVYDPPSHLLATANQRPVTAAYPYYIGTSANFFDPGYRAATIYAALRRGPLTTGALAAVQTSLTDTLATRIFPALLRALPGPSLSPTERSALSLLATWNGSMAADSAAASLRWTFWGDYLTDVFRPWWHQANVPERKDAEGLAVSADQVSLDEDLDAWTLGDQSNPAFSLPSGQSRTAPQVIRQAFATAVAHLASKLGGAPSSRRWPPAGSLVPWPASSHARNGRTRLAIGS